MVRKTESFVEFLARYSIYAIVPGMWFAYIAGLSPWYGAAGGFTLTFLIALPARLVNTPRQRNQSADS